MPTCTSRKSPQASTRTIELLTSPDLSGRTELPSKEELNSSTMAHGVLFAVIPMATLMKKLLRSSADQWASNSTEYGSSNTSEADKVTSGSTTSGAIRELRKHLISAQRTPSDSITATMLRISESYAIRPTPLLTLITDLATEIEEMEASREESSSSTEEDGEQSVMTTSTATTMLPRSSADQLVYHGEMPDLTVNTEDIAAEAVHPSGWTMSDAMAAKLKSPSADIAAMDLTTATLMSKLVSLASDH